ncbi:MAG: UDP-glucose 4-epimerase GalE [Cyclobacteriaceae bacterium]
MSRILVTGGAGYIGSHTVVELIQEGMDVVIIDDLSNSQALVIDKIEEITGTRVPLHVFDLCDKSRLDDFFSTEGSFDGIIHFAAKKAVGESVEKPLLYYHVNLVSLLNLLDCSKQFEIPNFVFSSSCTVYGQPDKLPVSEQTPRKDAESPYGNTKKISEDIIRDFAKVNKEKNTIALRYFNPVGAHESGLIGELPTGIPNNLMPFISQTAIGLRDQLKVFGGDYPTKDGSAVRDYIHVVDLAKAHVVSMQRLIGNKQKANYEFFNLGTGSGLTVLEVIKAFEEVNDIKINYEIVDRRPGDVVQIYADTAFANEELGWKTERDLTDMVKSTWKWEQSLAKLRKNGSD